MKTLILHQPTSNLTGGAHTFQSSIKSYIESLNHGGEYLFCPVELTSSPLFPAFLDSNEIELIWSLYPHFPGTHRPYVVTIWDLAHREEPIFPEFTTGMGGWPAESREAHYQRLFNTATFAIVGTKEGAKQVQSLYQFPEGRIRVIPFPVPYDLRQVFNYEERVLKEYELESNSYFIYPAQFWPHKNHVTLVEAFAQYLVSNTTARLVLTGSDKGNLQHVKSVVSRLGLEKKVVFPGFVDESVLFSLLHYSRALVFPSFFGPDNLPPIEAMYHRAPVIMSDIPGAREQCGDAALYFKPTSTTELLDKMRLVDFERDRLLTSGIKLVAGRNTKSYFLMMSDIIEEICARRKCWGLSYRES